MFFSDIKEKSFSKHNIYILIVILFILAVYFPAIDNYLLRDDFEWLNESYKSIKNPLILFEKINNFFRPIIKLSFIFNHYLFWTNQIYYNITTLFFHLTNVFLLYFLIKTNLTYSEKKNILIAIITSIGFGTSPLYSEITLWASGRPDSILLVFILTILILFTKFKENKKFSKKNQFVIFLLAICASFSKETWVLLPFLIFSFLFIIKKIKPICIIKKLLPILSLLFAYLIYFIGMPFIAGKSLPTGNYPNASIETIIKKFGHLIYKYAGLDDFYSEHLWESFLIIIILLILTVLFIYRKNNMALWGLVWTIITMSISLQIHAEVSPSRYNYLPLIGFWIMLSAFLIDELSRITKKYNSKIIPLIGGFLFSLLIIYQVIMVQWEIKDYRFQSIPYLSLTKKYLKIKDTLSLDKPIIFIDKGEKKAVYESANSMVGFKKLLYVRGTAIWQILHISSLHNFLNNSYNNRMEVVPKHNIAKIMSTNFQILVFTDSGFIVDNSYKTKLLDFYKQYKALPYKVSVVQIERF